MIFDLFSPIPSWGIRRWNAIGTEVEAEGCLMSFKIDNDESDEETKFAEDSIFLRAKY